MDTKKKDVEPDFIDDRLKLLSDATLRTEDGHAFHIHKYILAQSSEYFYALFCGMELNRNDVTIPGIGGEVMRSILHHIYTGNVHLIDDNVCELIMASDYLLLDDLLSCVKTFVKQIISVKNCLRIFVAAVKIYRDDISSDCYRFVQTHFEKVVYNGSAELGELPLETLKFLVCDRNLSVTSERTVHFTIVKWVEADGEGRLCWIPDLLKCMAISDVDECLAAEILEHDVVAHNPFCQDILDMKSTSSDEGNLKVIQKYLQDRPKAFYNRRLPSKLNCVARYTAINGIDSVEIYLTYDENIDLWRKVFEMDMDPSNLIYINDSIYMVMASENRYFCYNIVNKQWRELNDFIISRYNFAVVECEECIYVLGGISAATGDEIYDVEVYDPELDMWYFSSRMFPVSCFAAVSLNQRIYVVGYRQFFDDCVMVTQVFEAPYGIWVPLPTVSVERSHFALVAYLEKIYVIGGINGDEHLKDVEVFDPLTNQWSTGASLPHAYYDTKALVLQDVLIVCDNHWEDRSYLKTNPPVFWNVRKECWESFDESSPMNNLHLYHFFAVNNTESVRDITIENRDPSTSFEKSPFGDMKHFGF